MRPEQLALLPYLAAVEALYQEVYSNSVDRDLAREKLLEAKAAFRDGRQDLSQNLFGNWSTVFTNAALRINRLNANWLVDRRWRDAAAQARAEFLMRGVNWRDLKTDGNV